MKYYECRVKHIEVDANSGKERKVSPLYYVRAVSYTDAEAQIYKEMQACLNCEFEIATIRKTNLEYVFVQPECELWCKAVISIEEMSEDTGAIKRVRYAALVLCDDLQHAYKVIKEGMKDTVCDYSIAEVKESTIREVFGCLD